MGTNGLAAQLLDFKRRASMGAGKAFSFLALSAADLKLRPQKIIAISIEKGAVEVALASGSPLYRKIIKAQKFETGAGMYPGPSELATAAKAMLPGGQWNASLIIPEEWVMQRKASFPAAIRGDIPKAVAYDLDRLVPIGAGRMFYDWSIYSEDSQKITLDISAVKLEKVAQYIEQLKANGIVVSRLVYAGGSQPASMARWGALDALRLNPDAPNLLKNGKRQAYRFPVAGTAVIICALIGIWAYKITTPIGIEKGKIASLNRQVSFEKNKAWRAQRVEKEIGVVNGEIAAIQGFNQQRPLAIGTVKELTAIIPKSAWLTGLKFSGASIQIEGYAASATGLIPRLERSGYFKKAQFATPTLRDAKTRMDHFVIKAQLNEAAFTSPAKPVKPAVGNEKEKK
ncbi:MAG: PilN domain-containing protein [Actinomycetota bacterium]|nr:PilN domain-containing protein [Actinomycetota bacterium]